MNTDASSARSEILGRLHDAVRKQVPFERARDTHVTQPVTRIEGQRAELMQRFIAEAERVRGMVHRVANDDEARQQVIALLQQRSARTVVRWDGLPVDVDRGLAEAGIATVSGTMQEVAHADAGITSASCAIAATGTLVLEMGPGRSRAASLLVPVHLAIVRASQLVPRLEDYLARQRANHLQAFDDSSNIVFVTGASRTADIEMSVVYGVHGPLELHIVMIGE